MERCWTPALISSLLLLSGLSCTNSDTGGATAATGRAAPTFTTAREVLDAPAEDPAVAQALADLALDASSDSQLRYLAMRRLEEAGQVDLSITVAESVAEVPGSESFLRNNAIGLLARAAAKGRGRAGQVLERLRQQPEQGQVVAQLEARSAPESASR